MPVTRLSIEDFIHQSSGQLIIDVRSPGEYQHAHIPTAMNLPLFTDEERKVVGTAYKQQSRKHAIKYGLDFFGSKMRLMVEEVESLLKNKIAESILKDPAKSTNQLINPVRPGHPGGQSTLFLHCWRGGMRSSAVAWLLDLYGFNVQVLEGGYKSYRNWVLQQFDKEYDLRILGGYTGSGKTRVLTGLKDQGEPIIDLEGLANHKGSAFGAIGQPTQPTQEMFENLLAKELHLMYKDESKTSVWVEDESQRIGVLNIPIPLWKTMREKPVYFLNIPFEERLKYIADEYGTHDKEYLLNAIMRIQKRLGPLETKTAIQLLLENNYTECFRILLSYYDKLYSKALNNRENIASLLNKMDCKSVDTISNTKTILSCRPVITSV